MKLVRKLPSLDGDAVAPTGLGGYLAFGYKRDRVTVVGLLVAGTLVPIVALFL